MQHGTEDDIRRRAYELWEREGRPEGRQNAHWEQARRDVEGMAHPAPAGGLSEADTAGGGGAILPAAKPGEGRTTRNRAASGTAPARRKSPPAT